MSIAGGCVRSSASGSGGRRPGRCGFDVLAGLDRGRRRARRGVLGPSSRRPPPRAAGRCQVDRRLVGLRLRTVVGRDLVGMTLLPARLAFREFLVQVPRVEQHERRELDRAGRRMDRAVVARLDEHRQQPQWSRWAWVRTTASSSAGSNPNGIRFRTDSFGLPWNIPQSTRTFARSVVRRNWEPVTVVAPPRKWICMPRMVTGQRAADLAAGGAPSRGRYGEDERVDRDGQEQQ